MPAKALLCAGALALLVACVPPEPSNDEIPDYDETTAMGLIQTAGVLRVGLEADAFPLGARGRRPAGFTAEIGRELAGSLGVEPEFVAAPHSELEEMIDAGELDVAFPFTPVTGPAVDERAFSDPWWVGHQRLLTTGGGLEDVDDLEGAAVCDAPDRATGVAVEKLAPEVGEIVSADDPRRCRGPLELGRVEAASGPDLLLLPLLVDLPEAHLTGEQHTTAGYGAMMSKDAVGLNGFVDSVLREIDAEGRWEAWYEKYVTPLTGEPLPGIPTMTVEEAAALYPR